jgi:hypothetical protein
MRYIILVILCALNLSASAQWWRGDFKKHKRYPQIAQVKDHSLKKFLAAKAPLYKPKVTLVAIARSQFSLKLTNAL